jgi:hypothetical protein
MLGACVIVEKVKIRRLLINSSLHHAYVGSNIVSVAEQLTCISSLMESQEGASL